MFGIYIGVNLQTEMQSVISPLCARVFVNLMVQK